MKKENKFWPFNPIKSVLLSFLILIGLPVFFLLFHYWKGWPHESSQTVILIGILIIGILPVLLALLDIIIERGAVIQYKELRIDFSSVNHFAASGITVPANIGVRGTAVYDSDTVKILDALRLAKKSNIVIINIEEGTAWWDTRLLVLLSGAVRTGTPDKIVFVGNATGQEQCYLGWAEPGKLLDALLNVKPKYKKIYFGSLAAAKQWELIEPLDTPVPNPIFKPFPFGPIAAGKEYLVFDQQTGIQNEFLQEQLLQSQLGISIESVEQSKSVLNITQGKLIDMFHKVLYKDQIDENWAREEQLRIFFEDDRTHFVLTKNNQYLRIVSRLSILNEMFKAIVQKKNTANK